MLKAATNLSVKRDHISGRKIISRGLATAMIFCSAFAYAISPAPGIICRPIPCAPINLEQVDRCIKAADWIVEGTVESIDVTPEGIMLNEVLVLVGKPESSNAAVVSVDSPATGTIQTTNKRLILLNASPKCWRGIAKLTRSWKGLRVWVYGVSVSDSKNNIQPGIIGIQWLGVEIE